ncbi:hypothetical protein ABZP36_031490 [Zizania latifolia]
MNVTCAVIHEHQNCMKYGRPDVGFLRWRWRLERCDLPRFDAAVFLDLVRDRSLVFVGDSLARNHMQSLMCLLSKVEYPKDVSKMANQEFGRCTTSSTTSPSPSSGRHSSSQQTSWTPLNSDGATATNGLNQLSSI